MNPWPQIAFCLGANLLMTTLLFAQLRLDRLNCNIQKVALICTGALIGIFIWLLLFIAAAFFVLLDVAGLAADTDSIDEMITPWIEACNR